MGCCGQKRVALRDSTNKRVAPKKATGAAPTPAPRAVRAERAERARAAPTRPDAASATVRYLGSAPIRVMGAVTGRQYEFSRVHAVRSVDVRDAVALLRTSFFVAVVASDRAGAPQTDRGSQK